MARLRIERMSTRSASLNDKIQIVGQRKGFEDYGALLPDETISSWADRHEFIRLTSDDRDERDFGTLDVDLPGARQSLVKGLSRAATAPDAWLLRQHQRTLHCVRCLAEDRVHGLPSCERRAWSVAWRTCCPRHGMLFDSDREVMPSWYSSLAAPYWNGNEIRIVIKNLFAVVLVLDLHGDHRAIHLESALADEKKAGAWFPRGLDASSLRDAYRAIVTDLISQFYMEREGTPEGLPSGEFNRELNPNRFAVNAMAEAVLSEWTNTPLPKCASAQSTDLLVRAIGWGKGLPTVLRRGQVLVRGPLGRSLQLTRYQTLFDPGQHQNLLNPTTNEHWGYFTLPEARRLGIDICSAVRWLAELTRKGQFLAFDVRAGCLTENVALKKEFRLQPKDAEPYKLILPSWAFGPTEPPTFCNKEDYSFFGSWSPELLLRQKAKRQFTKKHLYDCKFQNLH